MRFDSRDPPLVVAYCEEHTRWAREQFPDGEVIDGDKTQKEQNEDFGELFDADPPANEEDATTDDGEGRETAGSEHAATIRVMEDSTTIIEHNGQEDIFQLEFGLIAESPKDFPVIITDDDFDWDVQDFDDFIAELEKEILGA